MTTDDRIDKIEKKIEEHDKKLILLEQQQMKDTFELKTMITDAVNNAIQPLVQKIDEQGKDQRIINEAQDKRITALEQAEANKALQSRKEICKTIKTVAVTAIISFLVTLLLNNFIATITESIHIENGSMEVKQ